MTLSPDYIELAERVDNLDSILGQFIVQTNRIISQLSREMREFKDEMGEFKDEMLGFKDEMLDFKNEARLERKEANKKWGELANKMGTLIEDIIAPGVGSVIKRYFSNEPDYMAINVKRKNRDSGIAGEFDIIASNDIQVFLIETRSSPKKQYIEELICEKQQRFRDLFPEYGHLELVIILASLRFDPELVAYASQRRVYLIGFREWEYLDILNFNFIGGSPSD